jgi:hypothetical protein
MNPYQTPISVETYSTRNNASHLGGLFLLAPAAFYIHHLTWNFNYVSLMLGVMLAIVSGLIAFSQHAPIVRISLILARVLTVLYVTSVLFMEVFWHPYHKSNYLYALKAILIGAAYFCGAFLPRYPRVIAESQTDPDAHVVAPNRYHF